MNATTKMIRLWQLISPTLPIGSFSYSQGMEFAIESGWLKTEDDIQQWLSQQLHHGLARLDLPLIKKLMQSWLDDDADKVSYWNQIALANRESAELLDEDKQVGYALCRLLTDLKIEAASAWQQKPTSYLTMYALICARWEIEIEQALAGFCWAWLENLVAAAIKLLPMGQTSGQKMLLALADEIEQAVATALQLDEEEIGTTLPGLAMASAFHETQYSRLFRS